MKLLIACALCCLAACTMPAFQTQKKWEFAPQAKEKQPPNTKIYFVSDEQKYCLGDFVGSFDTAHYYLDRIDLPDSTVAVCRGSWAGGNYWLAAVQKHNKIDFFEANEDSENYYEDYEEVLHFRPYTIPKP